MFNVSLVGFHTHVNNCRAPMRDVLLKAEKWTKNRYVARAEFPNLVTQSSCHVSNLLESSEKTFMNLLDIFFPVSLTILKRIEKIFVIYIFFLIN